MTAAAAAPARKSESAPKSPPAAAPAAPARECDAAATLAKLVQSGIVRAKLAIGSPNDPEEAAADRVADSVMEGAGACCPNCAAGGACGETLRMKPAAGPRAGDRKSVV